VRILLAILVYSGALLLVAAVSFGVVLLLAGPHAGILPGWLESMVLVLGWLAVLVIPILITRRFWRHLHRKPRPETRTG
jgi:membrane protein YdbS with pleckstrin-like domain